MEDLKQRFIVKSHRVQLIEEGKELWKNNQNTKTPKKESKGQAMKE